MPDLSEDDAFAPTEVAGTPHSQESGRRLVRPPSMPESTVLMASAPRQIRAASLAALPRRISPLAVTGVTPLPRLSRPRLPVRAPALTPFEAVGDDPKSATYATYPTPLPPVVISSDSRITMRRRPPPSSTLRSALIAGAITTTALCLCLGAALTFIYR